MMKCLKQIIYLIGVGVIIHFLFLYTNNTHIYNTLKNTILKGRLGPEIDEYNAFDNRLVKSTNYAPWKIAPNINSYTLTKSQQDSMRQLETVAFLVIQHDKILFEKYWEGYNENSLSNSFSMAKSILNIAIGALIREGKIQSLDDPIAKYLPKFNVTKYPDLSIRDLLQMSSGINFDENYINPFAYPAKANYGNDLENLTYSYKATEPPGKLFKYRSGNSQLLSFIIANVSKMSVSEYVSKTIWEKIGAKNTALWSLDKPNGSEKGFCCFNSNAQDFARIGKLYLNKGIWGGDTIVAPNYVNESITPAPIFDVNEKPTARYGLHWWLHTFKKQNIFYARGILGQYIIVVPEKKMIIVRLGHKRIKPTGIQAPPDLNFYLSTAFSIVE